MATTLCYMYVNGWSPKRCQEPDSKSVAKLYREIENRVDRFQRDVVVMKYLTKALDALEETLTCLLDTEMCFQKGQGKKGGKKGRKGNRRNRKGRKNKKAKNLVKRLPSDMSSI